MTATPAAPVHGQPLSTWGCFILAVLEAAREVDRRLAAQAADAERTNTDARN